MKEKKERSHDVTFVKNGDISAPQRPITGQASNSAPRIRQPIEDRLYLQLVLQWILLLLETWIMVLDQFMR